MNKRLYFLLKTIIVDGIIGLKYHLGGAYKMNKQKDKKELNRPQVLLLEMLENIYKVKK